MVINGTTDRNWNHRSKSKPLSVEMKTSPMGHGLSDLGSSLRGYSGIVKSLSCITAGVLRDTFVLLPISNVSGMYVGTSAL